MPKLPCLKMWRINAALTQQELARLATVSRTTVSRAEQGHSASILTARKLSDPLQCLPSDLMAKVPTL